MSPLRPICLALGAALLLLGSMSSAWAGACCVGTTSSQLGRLGPCEKVAAGLGYSLEALLGSWSNRGELRGPGDDRRLTHSLIGLIALRPDRRFQFGLSMPFLLQGKQLGAKGGVGGGPGDMNLWLSVEPFEDLGARRAPPVPMFGLQVRLPTGIPLDRAPGMTGAGATGAGHLALGPGLRVEKTFAKGALYLAGEAMFSLPRPDALAAPLPGVAWSASASGAFFVRADRTVSLSGGMTGISPALSHGRPTGRASHEPWLGLGLTVTPRRGHRWTFGLRHGLPVPALGRNQEGTLLFSVTGTRVATVLPAPRS